MAQVLEVTTKLASGGRIVIPAGYRRALGLGPGDEVVLRLEDGQIRLYNREQARRWAQEQVCKLVPRAVSLVQALLRDRRSEASRE